MHWDDYQGSKISVEYLILNICWSLFIKHFLNNFIDKCMLEILYTQNMNK